MGELEKDVVAALAMIAAALLAGLLCSGSRARRTLGLAVATAVFVPPWFASPAIVRGLLSLLGLVAFMRAIDLVNDPHPQTVARRVWHVISPVDSRWLHRVPGSFEGRAFGVCAAWLGLSVVGLGIAMAAGHLSGSGSWLARWFGGVLWVYATVELLWSGAGWLYRLLGFSTPPLHRHPIAARSVRELWGERWSRPINGWLHASVFRPCARRGFARVGLLAAFLASAVGHAYAVLVGVGAGMAVAMLAYFAVQGLLVLLERLLGVQRWGRVPAHVWLVSVMLLTSPLFVEPALRCVLGQ